MLNRLFKASGTTQKKDLPELISWCETIEEILDDDAEESPHIKDMIYIFVEINSIVHEGLDTDEALIEFIYKELLYNDDNKEYFHIPVFSYTSLTMKTYFYYILCFLKKGLKQKLFYYCIQVLDNASETVS